MLKSKLTAAVLAALAFGCAPAFAATTDTSSSAQPGSAAATGSNADAAQDQSTDTDTQKKAKRLDAVTVSGTLINNAQVQTAAPIYTITSQEIKARGFNSVAEVLQSSVMSTGSVQGPQASGGFTQGAQTISLYGLNPEYTLTLIDGRPITQFGQLYNGQSNFTNISNIPLAMIDHIDVLPGGASSIYGSQAIAGVVNIVTKQHMDGAEVLVRAGGYDGGGGSSQRLSLTFGHQFGKLDVLGAVEFDNQSPIWAYQRSFTATNPTPVTVARVLDYGTLDTYTGAVQGYVSPQDNCAAMSGLFKGTTVNAHSTDTSRTGTFCGSNNVYGYTTLQNQSRSYDGMLKLKYDLNEYVRFYGDALVDWQQQKWTPGSDFNWWGPIDYPGGLIEDTNGHILYPERVFGPEEVGNNYYNQFGRQDDLMYQADIGANGSFGDSNWLWDIYFVRSGDRTTSSTPERMAASVDNFFGNILGPSLGNDPNTGLNIYNPNYAQFYTPLTPAQLASFMQNVGSESNTWVNNTRATVSNSSLFSLPGGDAALAVLVEGGSQAWYEPINPLILNGDVWGLTGNSGGGTRSHAASAFEFNAPIWKMLTVDLSGRYDHYDASGSDTGKFTYKAGLEFRPFETLLLRGNYSTSFLAPDMSALYLGPSGNYQNITDYYLCATQGGGNNCSQNYYYETSGTTLANPKLKPTTAKSWSAGFVWAPINNLSITADYLHINISNEIAPQPVDLLMRENAQCLLGQLPANSPDCAAATSQVQRDPLTGQVSNITQYYINVASEQTESVTSQIKYLFNPSPVGQFNLQLDWNDMLKHAYQIYPGGPTINQLTNPLYSSEFKSIVSGALGWSFHDTWSSTVYYHRDGPSPNYTGLINGPNYPGVAKVAPWITWNWSVTYSPTKDVDVSLLTNNVFNKMPPKDGSYAGTFPYYNNENYNVYGREVMVQLQWRFGGHTGNG